MTPSILYHAVCQPGTGNLYSVTPAQLETHLKHLAVRGYHSLTVEDFMAAGPDRPAAAELIITFDDGSSTNYKHAAPLLERYGMTATFFVIAGRIGRSGKMDQSQVAELRRRGFSIQSHGLNHVDLVRAGDRTVDEELRVSKSMIEDITGHQVEHFSAPFGAVDQRLVQAARAAGYRALWTSAFGVNDERTDRFDLKRIIITRNTTTERLAGCLSPGRALRFRAGLRKRLGRALALVLGRRRYERLMEAMYGTYREG
ncbi:MAG: polysaccharide deacetylase family protein [Candidatus Edwardsbacteria bacterium]|nr:polysaccharide deacetylase family protein [Candidatus Edwardsbacteria bacterium]